MTKHETKIIKNLLETVEWAATNSHNPKFIKTMAKAYDTLLLSFSQVHSKAK